MIAGSSTADDGEPLFELGAALPPDGSPVWYFPGAQSQGGRADVCARVRRRDASTWIACLALRHANERHENTIFAMPCGERIYLVGGIADRDDPAGWRRVQVDQQHVVSWSPSRAVVLFNDYCAIEAHGRRGRLWLNERVEHDISINRVTEQEIVVEYYDVERGVAAAKRISLMTGEDAGRGRNGAH